MQIPKAVKTIFTFAFLAGLLAELFLSVTAPIELYQTRAARSWPSRKGYQAVNVPVKEVCCLRVPVGDLIDRIVARGSAPQKESD